MAGYCHWRGTGGVTIQIACTTYLFTIISFVWGLIGLLTGGYMLTEGFGIYFEGLLALIFDNNFYPEHGVRWNASHSGAYS